MGINRVKKGILVTISACFLAMHNDKIVTEGF